MPSSVTEKNNVMLVIQYCIIPVPTCIQSYNAKPVKKTQKNPLLNVRDELNITLWDVVFYFKSSVFGDTYVLYLQHCGLRNQDIQYCT